MKIRLTGMRTEVDTATARIGRVLTVLEISRPYPRRGNSALVSLYLDVTLDTPPRAAPTRRTPIVPEESHE